MSPETLPATRSAEPELLVLYDGACGFCSRSVRWLVRHDRDRRLRYARLQGQTAAELRETAPAIPAGLSTLVLFRKGRVWLRSRAVFEIARVLPWPWRAVGWLRALPRWLTDAGYRVIARCRLRLGGRAEACRLPETADARLFLP